jgi:hypothetical protein
VSLGGRRAELRVLFSTRVAPLFARREPRAAAKAMLEGLLSGLERKNGWWLAEHWSGCSSATPVAGGMR